MELCKYDYSVSFIRIMAMIMIVLCHVYNYIGIHVIGEFFNTGVPIFFFISGFVYANKNISNINEYLLKRTLRIFIPLYLWIIIYLFIFKIFPADFRTLLFNLLNMQGLFTVSPFFPDIVGPWFLSIIYLCYLYLPIHKKIENKFPSVNNPRYFAILVILFVILLFLNVNILGITFFMFGYYSKKNHWLEDTNFTKVSFAFSLSIMVRFISKAYATHTLYSNLFVPISSIMLVFSIVVISRIICKKFIIVDSLLKTKLFKTIDSISIYVYLTHELYMRKCIDLLNNIPVALFVILVYSFILSYILYHIGKQIERLILSILHN